MKKQSLGTFFATRWWPLASLALSVFAVIWIMSLPRPPSLVSVSATSEIVSVTVANPDAGAFSLKKARNAADGACHDMVFLKPNGGPSAPNEVRYQRLPDGALVVSVSGPTMWEDANGASYESQDITVFRISAVDANCRSTELTRLPAAGLLEIGAEPRNAVDTDSVQPMLLAGQISIFGRAIQSIGPIPLPSPPFAPGAIYPAQTVELLAGSRLAGASAINGQTTSWWGHVDVDLQKSDNGLAVRASTNADVIDVFPPSPPPVASFDSTTVPDRLSITLAAQLSKDPNIVWIGAGLAAILTLLGLIDRVMRTSPSPKRGEG